MESGPIIHEDLVVIGSQELDPIPSNEIYERRLLTISNGSGSSDVDVRLTETARIMLGGRDVDDFIEERVLELAATLPNDGRKLHNLEAHSPLTLSSSHVSI
jgi:hypothetical protein